MKLLLTSGGLTNGSIERALRDLVGKEFSDTKLVFIPTASNVESGGKEWFIDDLVNIKKQNFKQVAITDISAVPDTIWRPQLEEADILFFEGGNSYHLMQWMNKSGLVELLPEMLKTKVYVGLSAGSMIAGTDLNLRLSKDIYGDHAEKDTMPGLGLVDFYMLPHLNSPYFVRRMEKYLDTAMKEITKATYVLDDQSAIKILDGQLEVVSEGKWKRYN